jgi:ATP-binding cassette subfamily B multidrug efflux pump
MPIAMTARKPQNFFKTMNRLLSYFRGRRILLFLVIILSIYTAVANLWGTFLSKDIINNLNTYHEEPTDFQRNLLVQSCLQVGAIYLAGVIANLIYMQIMVHLTQRIIFQIRNELMEKMQKLPISYFDTHTHGEIMSYFTNDVDTLVMAMNDSFANIFLSGANIIGTIVCLFLINTYLSLIVFVFILGMFAFMFFNSRSARKYYRDQQEALSDVNSVVEEDIAGVKVEKAFSHEEESFQKFDKANRRWRDSSEKAFFHTQLNIPVIVSLSYFNFSVSSVVGIIFLCNGWLASGIGGLSSYLVYVRTSAQPFNYFTMHVNAILSCAAGAERIFRFLDEKEEPDDGKAALVKVKDSGAFTERYAWSVPNGTEPEIRPLRGVIEFRDVSFSYLPGKPILRNISFECHPGKKIAFVGSTGAGKTTIISLLARFYPVDSGVILYDGIPITEIRLESLRRAISMVTQDPHLFTGTIEDNIRYVRRHSSAEEIEKASEESQADSFIRRLPEGYQTMLYDDGANLSEGQRQLLALTRATLNQPPVMILDEATSNIDTRSEQLIQEGLRKLMKERTVIVIAHRLSTIRDADEILVLANGRIIERGTQAELIGREGAYYDLYTGKTELS